MTQKAEKFKLKQAHMIILKKSVSAECFSRSYEKVSKMKRVFHEYLGLAWAKLKMKDK